MSADPVAAMIGEIPEHRIAALLTEARRKAQLADTRAAEAIDVPLPILQQWESGQTRPPSKPMERLANLYGVSVATLLRARRPVRFDRPTGTLIVGDSIVPIHLDPTD